MRPIMVDAPATEMVLRELLLSQVNLGAAQNLPLTMLASLYGGAFDSDAAMLLWQKLCNARYANIDTLDAAQALSGRAFQLTANDARLAGLFKTIESALREVRRRGDGDGVQGVHLARLLDVQQRFAARGHNDRTPQLFMAVNAFALTGMILLGDTQANTVSTTARLYTLFRPEERALLAAIVTWYIDVHVFAKEWV